jgi:hypothetical protein
MARITRQFAGRRQGFLAAGRACVLAAVLLLLCAPARGQQPGAEAPPASEPPARPIPTPEALGEARVDPRWGFQFAWGLHNLDLEVPEVGTTFEPRSLTKDGVSLTLELVLGAFRLGYLRQVFRREPSEAIIFRGDTVTLLGYESDQFWAFHGFRPWAALYLGYGLGWQRREISVQRTSEAQVAFSEDLAMAGVILDWAFTPPFSLQVRSVREEGGKFFRVSGETILLAYIVPF